MHKLILHWNVGGKLDFAVLLQVCHVGLDKYAGKQETLKQKTLQNTHYQNS